MQSEYFRNILNYNPDTGIFRWKKSPSKRLAIGAIAGSLNRGYVKIIIAGKRYFAHRIAWIYIYGQIAEGMEIDHINHVRDDNRICNLRAVSKTENNRNKKMSSNNKSGITGVFFSTEKNMWRVTIGVNKKTYHLGYTRDLSEGRRWRKLAQEKYGFHDNHGIEIIHSR